MAQIGKCSSGQICCVNDAVCCSVEVVEGNGQLLYTNNTGFVINGTVLLENMGAPGSAIATVTINGVTQINAAPGECESITVNDIQSITVSAAGGTGTASVKVAFSLNYKF